jgi:xanthine dehydrogenase accessory factor
MSAPAVPRSRPTVAPAPLQAAWLKPLRDWPCALLRALEHEPIMVRIVVTEVLGSAPREAGVSMLVGHEDFEGTIGGGQLEWQALAAARTLLAVGAPAARIDRMVLGADLTQCCGGVVAVWMERYTRADRAWLRAASDAARCGAAVLISRMMAGGVEHQIVSESASDAHTEQLLRAARARALPRLTGSAGCATLQERLDEALPALWLYGAGHVGQALARIVAELPLRLTWIDSRAELFPAQMPDSIRVVHAPDPRVTVANAAAGTRFLVLTHSHPLDYALCRAILERGDFASLGLIGSKSKGARFRSRLARDGLPPDTIARLLCPIGEAGIDSKWPTAIAVAVACQLLRAISDGAAAEQPACQPAADETTCAAPACASCRSSEVTGQPDLRASRQW